MQPNILNLLNPHDVCPVNNSPTLHNKRKREDIEHLSLPRSQTALPAGDAESAKKRVRPLSVPEIATPVFKNHDLIGALNRMKQRPLYVLPGSRTDLGLFFISQYQDHPTTATKISPEVFQTMRGYTLVKYPSRVLRVWYTRKGDQWQVQRIQSHYKNPEGRCCTEELDVADHPDALSWCVMPKAKHIHQISMQCDINLYALVQKKQ
jgi:hypothetical protein